MLHFQSCLSIGYRSVFFNKKLLWSCYLSLQINIKKPVLFSPAAGEDLALDNDFIQGIVES